MRTYRFCAVYLIHRWTGVSNWEKQLGVYGQASSLVAPIHVFPPSVEGENDCVGKGHSNRELVLQLQDIHASSKSEIYQGLNPQQGMGKVVVCERFAEDQFF